MTMAKQTVVLGLLEICQAVDLPEQLFIELVEHDIITPQGSGPEEWSFDLQMISVARRASRLQRDFDLEWSAVALLLDLLEQRDRLLADNQALRQSLERFLHN